MHFGRFRRIAAIHPPFRCERCPIVIRRGSILHDRSRGLQLLSLIVTNRGNVTVDEIEIKVIAYDRFGNAIPEENGEIGQICQFSDSGCLPDQSIGEGEVILLPSTKAVDCDVFVTRVRTAGNVELTFTDDDYAYEIPEVMEEGVRRKRNKQLFIGLLASLVLVTVLYTGITMVGWHIENRVLPEQREELLLAHLAEHDYDRALKQLADMEDPDGARREAIVQEALAYYMALEDHHRALSYAAKSKDGELYTETFHRILDRLEEGGRFDTALEFVTARDDDELRRRVFTDAIAYYSGLGEFSTALKWVALSGDTTLSDGVWRDAVAHYAAKGDPVTALDYALKTEDHTVIASVYDLAVRSLYEQGSYDQAALYMARSGIGPTEAVPDALRLELLDRADPNFIRLHIRSFHPVMSFAQKQALYAIPLAIDEAIIACQNDGSAVSGLKGFTWIGYDAVSVDISRDHAVVLRADGTVYACGDNLYRQCETSEWEGIVGLACGDYHTVGLMEDGTVIAVGSNEYGQCDVGQWRDIVQIVCGPLYTLGLRRDGTVLACGRNNAGQCDVQDWQEVIFLSAGENHALALHYDGTVEAAGVTMSTKCAVTDWADVVHIAAGSDHSAALLRDGGVLLAGGSSIGIPSISWPDTAYIAAGERNLLGIRPDGAECLGTGKVSTSGLGNVAL